MRRSLSVFLLVLCILMTSCAARKNITCESVLEAALKLCNGQSKLNGQVLLLSADEGSLEYFSEDIRAQMYGERALGLCFPKIEDCAVFTSAHIPEEIAVFKCYSYSDTDEVSKMCLERADEIKVALRGSVWAEKAEKIRVTIHRRFVVFSFTDNPEIIEKRVRELI